MANQPLKRYDTATSTWVGITSGSVSDGTTEYTVSDITAINTQLALAVKKGDLFFNIKDYGALSNGTDATSFVQSVVNAAPYGSTIWIPTGTFKISQINISSKLGLTFTGVGELKSRADVLSGVTSINAMFNISSSNDITIEKLKISGMRSGIDDRAIWITDSSNINIRENRITNFGQEAMMLWGSNSATEPTNHIYDNYFYSNNYAIKLQTNAEYYHIHRNKFISNTWGIIGSFSNCRFDNNMALLNDYGVYLDSSMGSNPDHTSFSGNVINHNKIIGALIANTVNGMQVVDNQFLSTVGGTWPTTGKAHSLVLINVKDISFIGNRVDADASTSSYIYVSGHSECRYIGNTFFGGNFKEVTVATGINVFTGNRFLTGSSLALYASSPKPLRMGDIEGSVFINDTSSALSIITLTKQGGWVNVSGFDTLKAWKDSDGMVHIQGSVMSGAVGSYIATLPSNLWPAAIIDIACSANNTGDNASVRVYTNGNIQHLSGGNTLVSINGSFRP
jgi:parallel beta-helix repeat protein